LLNAEEVREEARVVGERKSQNNRVAYLLRFLQRVYPPWRVGASAQFSFIDQALNRDD